MSFFGKEASYNAIKTKQVAIDDFFPVKENNRDADFRFEQIKFKASLIGPAVGPAGDMKN